MRNFILIWMSISAFSSSLIFSNDAFQEFKIKRKNIFEFTKKPELIDDKNSTTISFTVKDFCDVTIAIENAEGKILRHLASGVLGDKAPEPFKKNSLEQSIIWDNKDDAGKYLDDKASLRIRVSLGLQAEYEKDLYYSPYKRISSLPVMVAAPEGVYVYEGNGRDHLRLFGHDGVYNKTIYPFPASQLKKVEGLNWIKAPDGHSIPNKESLYKQTLLNGGENDNPNNIIGMSGLGATCFAVKNKRIALGFEHLNRLTYEGNTGGFLLKGGKTGFQIKRAGYGGIGAGDQLLGPTSMAFSPDGKTVYLTGYMWQVYFTGTESGSYQGVYKINYETNDDMDVFAGFKTVNDYGSDEAHFAVPTSVDTDKDGKVYVSDFMNNRIQIFEPSGKLLKSLSVNYPAKVLVHQKTGEIYVFSWDMMGIPPELDRKVAYDPKKVPRKAFIFSAYPEMKLKQENEFPLGFGAVREQFIFLMGQNYQVALDSWSEEPTIWVVGKKFIAQDAEMVNGINNIGEKNAKLWELGIRRVQFKNGKWEDIGDFNSNVKKDLVRSTPPAHNIQQLYFNHKNEKLYVGEADSGPTVKAFNDLIEIDPVTANAKIIKLPFNPCDIDFDINGLIYMRTMNVLGRYDMSTWKEVPFDYGEEREKVGDDGSQGGRIAPLVSGIMLPATNAVCYHQGGLSVNVKGDIAVACHNRTENVANPKVYHVKEVGITARYSPIKYPGRFEDSKSVSVHIWDKLGKVKSEDVVKGAPQTDGVFIDKEGNIYMMSAPARLIEGKPIDDGMSSTLIKFKSNSKGRFLTDLDFVAVPLEKAEYPKRPYDLQNLWIENYEWMYGGVGFAGFNAKGAGGGCACWFARFKLDYFARSIVPEPMQFSVGVLDSAGNLILKIGQYGNEDSMGKNSKEPLGGDETGLFHPCFVATHSDRRIFISDIGNEKVISVKLKYTVDEILQFKK